MTQPGARLAPTYTAARLVAIVVLIIVITAGHMLTDRATHHEHMVHVLLRVAYLLPILLGAVWYGTAGAIAVTAMISIVYGLHIATAWQGDSRENVNQLAMLGAFWVLGVTAGVLIDLKQRAHRLHREAEERTQREVLVYGLGALEAALKSRDENTHEHGEAVAALAADMADMLGLPPGRRELVRLAGRVHDLGKIGVRDDVLYKPDRLSPDELARMRQHPQIAADILAAVPGTREIARIVRAHHEYLDGSGYPEGLRAEQIPFEAQILTVADVFCALTDDRAYHAAKSVDEALAVLDEWTPRRVAPGIVRALRAVLDRRSRHP